MTKKTILNISNLRVDFRSHKRNVTALRNVSLGIKSGETLALVGESGSGKSVTALAIMGLLPSNGSIVSGAINYYGKNKPVSLEKANTATIRSIRGEQISMIFQEPMSSLNPLFTIGDQIGEMLILHSDMNAVARKKRIIEMLELVEIPAASSLMNSYPHELSGGMRQRIMIALALVCNPKLLIADEPTTALDVTIQAQILDLMRRLQKELGMSILFITHDMGVVAEMADDVAVMYAGSIIEQAAVKQLFSQTMHPYTQGLLGSIPKPNRKEGELLIPISGTVPPLYDMPKGCAFSPRCNQKFDPCDMPIGLRNGGSGHMVACHKITEIAHE